MGVGYALRGFARRFYPGSADFPADRHRSAEEKTCSALPDETCPRGLFRRRGIAPGKLTGKERCGDKNASKPSETAGRKAMGLNRGNRGVIESKAYAVGPMAIVMDPDVRLLRSAAVRRHARQAAG